MRSLKPQVDQATQLPQLIPYNIMNLYPNSQLQAAMEAVRQTMEDPMVPAPWQDLYISDSSKCFISNPATKAVQHSDRHKGTSASMGPKESAVSSPIEQPSKQAAASLQASVMGGRYQRKAHEQSASAPELGQS